MKNRNLFLYFLLAMTVAFSAGNIQSTQTIYLPSHVIESVNNKNTVFLWDFHDVIAMRNYKATFLAIWNSDKKISIIRTINLQLLKKLFTLLGKSITANTSVEELVQIIKQSNNPDFEKLIVQIANAQEPITGTVDLIDALYQLGYRHYIGSNIGATIFAEIVKPSQYPQFATLFAQFDLNNPQTVTFDPACPKCTLKKPNIRFYQTFLQRNDIDLSTTNVIFIDDRLENVIGAQKAGLIGIRFISPEQLRADLEELGVLIPCSQAVDFQSHPVV